MCFGADGAERHGTGGKALDDFPGRLDFVNRDGFGRIKLELEQAAQGHVAAVLVVDELGVLFVRVPAVRTGGVLQLGNRVGGPHVLFAAYPPGVFTAGVQHIGQHRVMAERSAVHTQGFLCNLKHAHAFDLAGCAREEFGDGAAIQTNGLEQLRTAVAHVGGHAHFGHDLGQTLAYRLDVVVDRLVGAQVARQVL